jgi:hypothetical protein
MKTDFSVLRPFNCFKILTFRESKKRNGHDRKMIFGEKVLTIQTNISSPASRIIFKECPDGAILV